MTEANVPRARVRVRRTDEAPSSEKLNTEIYSIANEISRYFAQPEVIEKIMEGREWVQNMIEHTGLDASEITNGAEERMFNIVDLITFKPKHEGSTRLEVIGYTIKILEAHAEELAGEALYASFDIAIERLKKLEAIAIEELKYKSTAKSSSESAPVINHNTVYINNAGDANIDVSFVGQKLTSPQIGKLKDAILGGFPENELKILLNVNGLANYDNQVSGDTYTTRVFNLITKVIMPQGHVDKFVEVLFRDKPNSPYLKQFLDYMCPPSGGNNYINGNVVQGNQFTAVQHNHY